MKEKDEISKVKKSTIEELFCRSKKYRQTTGFIRFFEFIARINNHSRFNSMLVYNQDETVTFFGSAKYWQDSYRRTVKEDARKYVILQPFAPIMWVYDIFMTEGRETPREILENGAGTEMFQIKGKIDNQILYDAISITQSWGIGVTFKPLSFFNTVQVSGTSACFLFLSSNAPGRLNTFSNK